MAFPLEFPFVRAVSEPPVGGAYVVGAMMTPNYAHHGERLSNSCRAHSLPLALFEVPSVHRSISPKGADDPQYSKANFVHYLLDRYRRPVLYVDVDCVIAQRPVRIEELLASRVDFAVFNWLAEEHTEAYVQTTVAVMEGSVERILRDRFYRFSHSIDLMSESQLLCSGAVQLYNDTAAARTLLANWHGVIERAPGSADDKCLDFAVNNFPADGPPLRTAWLEKSYARYAWWIYERPVIDHPEFPHSGQGFEPMNGMDGKPRIHKESLRRQKVEYTFPKNCLIDTETRTLLRMRAGAWHAAEAIPTPLWLSPTAGSPESSAVSP